MGTWRASGLYFDVARLDSLFSFLLLASLYALRFARSTKGAVVAALLGTLAVMTKQTGAVVLAPVALWCAWADYRAHGRELRRFGEWQRFLGFGIPLAAGVGLSTLLLNGIVDERFLLHIVTAGKGPGDWRTRTEVGFRPTPPQTPSSRRPLSALHRKNGRTSACRASHPDHLR